MKKLMETFEKLMMAVAFAEAGEHETSKEIMEEPADVRSNQGVIICNTIS